MSATRHLYASFLVLVIAGVPGASCARTADDGSPAQTVDWSPIHDEADDATAAIGTGWTRRDAASVRSLSMGERASVVFSVTRPGAFDALLDAVAFGTPRRVQIDVDGKPIAPPFQISVDSAPAIVLPIGTLSFGPHQIHFVSVDGAGEDASGKRVSVAIRSLTLERVGG